MKTKSATPPSSRGRRSPRRTRRRRTRAHGLSGRRSWSAPDRWRGRRAPGRCGSSHAAGWPRPRPQRRVSHAARAHPGPVGSGPGRGVPTGGSRGRYPERAGRARPPRRRRRQHHGGGGARPLPGARRGRLRRGLRHGAAARRRAPDAVRARPHPPRVRAAPAPRQAAAELRAAGGRPHVASGRPRAAGSRGAAPSPLTPQERRVAAAVVTGASNREVAAELFLSPKTIEFHLGQIYRKLGVHSRTQLAAALRDAPGGGQT